MPRRSLPWLVAFCEDRDDCGWRDYVGVQHGATMTDPSYVDGDVPDECPDCGGPVDTDTEYLTDDDFDY